MKKVQTIEDAIRAVFGGESIPAVVARVDAGYRPTIRADVIGWRWATAVGNLWAEEFFRQKGRLSLPYYG